MLTATPLVLLVSLYGSTSKTRGVADSNTSGLAGIAVWINQYYGLKGAEAIDKKNEGVVTIKELIDQEYANGRITVISETEMIRYAEQYVFHRDVDYEDK